MPTAHKSTKTAAAPEKHEAVENFFPMFTRSVERFAEFQKETLETAARQNTDWMETWKKTARLVPQAAPAMFMFDLWGQAFDRFVETQKGSIDLAVEQTEEATKLARERGSSLGKATEGFTAIARQAVEQTVAAQKKALSFYAEQQKTAFDAVKRQFRFTNTPAAEAFQSGLDAILETQKAMLDMAAKPLHTAVR